MMIMKITIIIIMISMATMIDIHKEFSTDIKIGIMQKDFITTNI